jgi:transposase
MRYTPAEREDLARRKEQWVLRTARGEAPERVRRELKLKQKVRTLALLRPRYQQGGRTWKALLERRHGVATKGTPEVKAFVIRAKAKNSQLTAAALVAQIWERFEIEISLNRLNEILKVEGLSNPVGRPKRSPAERAPEPAERDVDHAGAFFPSGSGDRTGRARGRARRS